MGNATDPAALNLRGAVVGRVTGIDGSGRPLVAWPDSEDAPRAAEVLQSSGPIDWGACRGLRCLLVFPSGSGNGPVLLGLLDPPPEGAQRGGTTSAPATDKERVPDCVRLEGNRELILECGQAKISLRSDGRIVILGGYVLSRSTGVQKIQGASVQIN